MDLSIKNRRKLLAITGLVSLFANDVYALTNAAFSPLQTQKVILAGVGAVQVADFNPPVKFECADCIQTIKKDNIFFVNYAIPTSTSEQGRLSYWFYTGDPSNFNTECPYDVIIPFSIDKEGHFNIVQNNYPATLTSQHAPNCEKHAFTTVAVEGDIIRLNNQVMG